MDSITQTDIYNLVFAMAVVIAFGLGWIAGHQR